MSPEELVIDQRLWEIWLEKPTRMQLLSDVETDPSTECDLLDALDVELRNELSLDTIVERLMKLRGPISKLDIVATRLETSHIMRITMDICHRFGITYTERTARTTDLFSI